MSERNRNKRNRRSKRKQKRMTTAISELLADEVLTALRSMTRGRASGSKKHTNRAKVRT